jgi:hypothetical protein
MIMLKRPVLTATMAAVCASAAPATAFAATGDDIVQMRDEIRQMKQEYEARIRSLEQRLQAAEAQPAPAQTPSPLASGTEASPAMPASLAPAGAASANTSATAFNPAISAILGGTYANLSQDPKQFRLQGFVPGGESAGPGNRSFNLGESELTLSANIDPQFAGLLTFALGSDNSVSVEEAYFQTKGLSNGLNLKGGRMLSSIGYLNSIHAHAWDFVDAPLAYQAFLGGQYKTDGVQFKWLAPTERFLELGLEAGNGAGFPGNDRNRNGVGSTALFAHLGDDIGENASWRAGVSYLHTGASDRAYEDIDSAGNGVTNAISGRANTWIVDGVYKWAPNGNATRTNFKLQGEYFRRRERGTIAFDTTGQSLAGAYASSQSGWYLQGIYQFMPLWRVGLRYDRLSSGTPDLGAVSNVCLPPIFRSLPPITHHAPA